MAGVASTQRYWFRLLDGSWEVDTTGRWLNVFMVALIGLNVLMVILESVPSIAGRYTTLFSRFELFSVAVFSIEYILRCWASPADPRGIYARPVAGRLRYMISPMAVIDLLAIAPFFLQRYTGIDLRFLRVFRLFRLLKLTRYFPALTLIGRVANQQRRALLSALFVMLTLLITTSSVMYLIEREAQPEAFGSIPAAMWWGMATLTTVGYGDVVPVTVVGQIAGTVIALSGIAMFALPAAILASGFAQEIRQQDFLTSWRLVASLPPFRQLAADDIADIVGLLHERVVVPDEWVFAHGDKADAVYFIVAGDISLRYSGHEQVLQKGDFFGELALIHHRERIADAIASTSTHLLVLDRDDFHDLCRDKPLLREHIEAIAAQRVDELGENL